MKDDDGGFGKIKEQKKGIGNNHNFFTDDPDDPYAGKRFKGKSDPNEKKPCGICGKPVSKSNFNRHLRTHPEYEEDKDYGQSECTVFIYYPFYFSYIFHFLFVLIEFSWEKGYIELPEM